MWNDLGSSNEARKGAKELSFFLPLKSTSIESEGMRRLEGSGNGQAWMGIGSNPTRWPVQVMILEMGNQEVENWGLIDYCVGHLNNIKVTSDNKRTKDMFP